MKFQSKKVMPRYFCLIAVLAFICVLVLFRAGYIMTVEREYWLEIKRSQTRDSLELKQRRGDILANDGRILATSLNEYVLHLDFMTYEKDSVSRVKDQYRRDTALMNNIDSIARGMHRLFPDIDPEKYKKHLLKGRELKSHYWPVYPPEVTSLKLGRKERKNRQLTYLQKAEIEKLPLMRYRSSLNSTAINMRKNPYGRIAFRTVGEYRDEPRFGLELSFDSILAGKPGHYHREKVLNAWIQVVDQPAEDGCDIMTTLDIDMQDIVESVLNEELKALDAHAGVCIVMEVATGDVRAIASLQRNSDGSYTENEPRAVSTHYEPGSVFKPMSFLVAFDDGKVKVTDQVDINGGIYTFGTRKLKDSNYRSGGTVGPRDVKFIIQNSSNVGTARLIDQAYLSNPQQFIDGLHRVGAGEDLKVPIDGYLPPHFCSPSDKSRYWSRTDLPWMSIGYVSQLPPINILNFYNGIANNGRLMRPRFVKAVLRNGKVVKEYPPVVLREHMAKPEAVRDIQECLKAVVNGGSGKRAGSKYFRSAGKTGTAQIWTGRGRTSDYSLTFVGYFPADRPLYSCVVNIQKTGPFAYGWMSGKVFKRVSEHIMARYNEGNYKSACDTTAAPIPEVLGGNLTTARRVLGELSIPYEAGFPLQNDSSVWGCDSGVYNIALEPRNVAGGHVPDVIGYGLRDAVYLLESHGLRVRASGAGRVVHQSKAGGESYHPGDTIRLVLDTHWTKVKKRPKTVTSAGN